MEKKIHGRTGLKMDAETKQKISESMRLCKAKDLADKQKVKDMMEVAKQFSLHQITIEEFLKTFNNQMEVK